MRVPNKAGLFKQYEEKMMSYTFRRRISIKADNQYIWDVLTNCNYKYFRHIVCKKDIECTKIKPSYEINGKTIAWDAKHPGELELYRYQDLAISNNIKSIIYNIKSNNFKTWVDIELILDNSRFNFLRRMKNFFVLRDVVDDNLIWLKTTIEDQLDYYYNKNIFLRKSKNSSFDTV